MTRLLSSITFLAAAACSHAGDEVALQADASSDALLPDAAARKEAGPLSCPTDLPGPPLIQIPVEDSEYCIDAREVTQAQYQQFVAAVGTIPPESPDCEGNEELVPRVDETGGEMPFGTCPPGYYDPVNLGDRSMVCVDWCDAAAFCAWAGKRLCGALPGRERTRETREAFAETEWRYACTNGGTTTYPYGDDYMDGVCSERIFPSPGSASCAGLMPPFSEVRDLAGGVREWTLLCEGRSCSIEGFSSDQGTCSGGTTPKGRLSGSIGFRCCADVR